MTAQFAIDFDEGARRRDVGHADALTHEFVSAIRDAIVRVAETEPRFTSETVLATLPAPILAALARFPNALGACFRAEALADRIEATAETRHADRPEARKRRLVVWRGRPLRVVPGLCSLTTHGRNDPNRESEI